MEKKYLTENLCYKKPVRIFPKYLIIHSTGVGYKNKEVFFNKLNRESTLMSVHGLVDDVGAILTLPLDYKAWHVQGENNDLSVGIEICEPENIVYSDSAHTKIDETKYNPKTDSVKQDFLKRYRNAVRLASEICKELKLEPEKILSHSEAHKLGIASNHADVSHWFPLFDKTMDNFREDVREEMREKSYVLYTVKKGDSWWKIALEQMGKGIRFEELALFNQKTSASVLHIGDVIKIPLTDEKVDLELVKCKLNTVAANVREAPGATNKRVTTIVYGATVYKIVGDSKKIGNINWVKIRLSDNREGYIAEKYLKEIK